MSAPDVYAAIKFWLPMCTAFGLLIGTYRSVRAGVTSWADKLMNNHLSHIQIATERTATLLAQSQAEQKQYQNKDEVVQREILTSLAILKDRQ